MRESTEGRDSPCGVHEGTAAISPVPVLGKGLNKKVLIVQLFNWWVPTQTEGCL